MEVVVERLSTSFGAQSTRSGVTRTAPPPAEVRVLPERSADTMLREPYGLAPKAHDDASTGARAAHRNPPSGDPVRPVPGSGWSR